MHGVTLRNGGKSPQSLAKVFFSLVPKKTCGKQSKRENENSRAKTHHNTQEHATGVDQIALFLLHLVLPSVTNFIHDPNMN